MPLTFWHPTWDTAGRSYRTAGTHRSGGRWTPVALLLALALCGPRDAVAAAKVGQPAPAARGVPIASAAAGTAASPEVSLRSLRGQVVLVDFWATWCAPCKASLPFYARLQAEHRSRGLRVLAVSVDDDASVVRRFVARRGLKLTVLHDKGGRIAERFGPERMPTAYIIDRNGVVRWIHSGFETGDTAEVARRVRAALGPKPAASAPSAPSTPSANPPIANWARVERRLMGTRFVIMAQVGTAAQRRAIDAAFARVASLERRWSPWVVGSDIARLNAAPVGRPVQVHADTAALLQRARALCRRSKGAFDATFFSLSALWDLKAAAFRPPSPAQVTAALQGVGCERLSVDTRTLTRRHARTRVHLGGSGKGAALDAAASVLRAAGISRFVVDGGGDMLTSGVGPKGPWRVGIRRPRGPAGKLAGRLLLQRGEAVATSGDYERFALHAGRRYHHIIDPRSGWPARGAQQVTVLVREGERRGERADALATAVFVLGPAPGIALIDSLSGVEAMVVAGDGKAHVSKGMQVAR